MWGQVLLWQEMSLGLGPLCGCKPHILFILEWLHKRMCSKNYSCGRVGLGGMIRSSLDFCLFATCNRICFWVYIRATKMEKCFGLNWGVAISLVYRIRRKMHKIFEGDYDWRFGVNGTKVVRGEFHEGRWYLKIFKFFLGTRYLRFMVLSY